MKINKLFFASFCVSFWLYSPYVKEIFRIKTEDQKTLVLNRMKNKQGTIEDWLTMFHDYKKV